MDSELTPQTPQGSASAFGNKGRILSITVLVIIVVAAGIGYWYWQKDTLVQSIKKSLVAGDYKTALATANAQVTKNAHNAEFLALQSLALSQQTMNTFSVDPRQRITYSNTALQAAQAATAADAHTSDAWRALGDAYFTAQQWSQAHAAFQKASALNPKDAYVQFDDAQTYFFEGDVNNAIKTYQKALAVDPTLVRANAGIGRIYYDQNAFATSTTEFQKAYSGETNTHIQANDAYYLGMLALANNDYANAKTYFTKGTTLDASSSLPWLGLGSLEFTAFQSTSTEIHTLFSAQNPLVLLASSFNHIGIATANDPSLLASKVQTAYQMYALGNSQIAQQLLANASSTLAFDLSINPEERTILLNRLVALKKPLPQSANSATKASATTKK